MRAIVRIAWIACCLLASLLTPAIRAKADAIAYTTSSLSSLRDSRGYFIGPTNGTVAGTDVVRFDGVANGSYVGAYDPSAPAMDLGRFVVSAAPSGTTTTYANAPFAIQFDAPKLYQYGTQPTADGSFGWELLHYPGFTITGMINGTVNDHGQGALTVTINAVHNVYPNAYIPETIFSSALPFRLRDIQIGTGGSFLATTGQLPWAPSVWEAATFSGSFALNLAADGGVTQLEARVIPEPTTIAIFFATFAAVLARRRATQRRAS
jgi:hypothetical protein